MKFDVLKNLPYYSLPQLPEVGLLLPLGYCNKESDASSVNTDTGELISFCLLSLLLTSCLPNVLTSLLIFFVVSRHIPFENRGGYT